MEDKEQDRMEVDVVADVYNDEEKFIKEVETRVRDMLKMAMALRGKSVEEVAERAGLNPVWLEKVLDGRREMPLWLIGRLSYFLDFSVDFNIRPTGRYLLPARISLVFEDR